MAMKRMAANEVVLYYTPQQDADTVKLKGVLVRLGIRIKNVEPGQTGRTVGSLLGLAGAADVPGGQAQVSGDGGQAQAPASDAGTTPVISEKMLVMHNFTGKRIDELLLAMRRAGVPKVELKAVVTESNASWSFYHLYEEIKEEHETMRDMGGKV